MARLHGKDLTAVNVDTAAGSATDLKAQTTGFDFQVSAEQHDTTTIGDDWREFTGGLKGGDEFTHDLFYEDGASPAAWSLYAARLGVEGTFSFTDGVRTVSMETVVTKLSMPVSVGDMVKFTATHKITGAVTFS